MERTDKKIEPKTEKIPVKGALWIMNPAGSQYKDPDTKQMVTRQEPTLQYSKSGVPQKWQFSEVDISNLLEFIESKQGQDFIKGLPETITLEPGSV